MSSSIEAKYASDGRFQKQGTNTFFLLNIEATLYLLLCALVTHVLITLLRQTVSTEGKAEKDLNVVNRQILKKYEAFGWEAFPR